MTEKSAPYSDNKVHETVLEINLTSLFYNLQFFKNTLLPKTKLMLMVKASAYGIGAIEIAKQIEKKGLVDYFAAYIDEGVELREAGIKSPIMVLNPSASGFEQMANYCLEPEIHNLQLLASFSEFAKQKLPESNYPVHLKFNTGMNRLGIDAEKVNAVFPYFLNNNSIALRSVMTHLSSSDNKAHDDFTRSQFNSFERIKKEIETSVNEDVLFHCLNSNGIYRFPEKQMDMVRLGIGLYGASAVEELKVKLKPICTLKTKVSSVRKVKKGDSVSYDRSGIAKEDTFIATLAIGYADGFLRASGNGNWSVEINGKLYPTIGNICMDLSMVNIGDDSIEIGDDVVIFGKKKSIHDYAKSLDTISYEALTNLGKRVKRVFLSN